MRLSYFTRQDYLIVSYHYYQQKSLDFDYDSRQASVPSEMSASLAIASSKTTHILQLLLTELPELQILYSDQALAQP